MAEISRLDGTLNDELQESQQNITSVKEYPAGVFGNKTSDNILVHIYDLTENYLGSSHPSKLFKQSPGKSGEVTVKTKEILNNCKDVDVIGIDEAQFFDQSLIQVCNSLANNGLRVIVAGLDMDYEGNPFGPMPDLMACAEDVKKVHSICVETGNPAGYSFRKEKNKDLVLIGEKKEYEPLSREIFIKKMSKKIL